MDLEKENHARFQKLLQVSINPSHPPLQTQLGNIGQIRYPVALNLLNKRWKQNGDNTDDAEIADGSPSMISIHPFFFTLPTEKSTLMRNRCSIHGGMKQTSEMVHENKE